MRLLRRSVFAGRPHPKQNCCRHSVPWLALRARALAVRALSAWALAVRFAPPQVSCTGGACRARPARASLSSTPAPPVLTLGGLRLNGSHVFGCHAAAAAAHCCGCCCCGCRAAAVAAALLLRPPSSPPRSSPQCGGSPWAPWPCGWSYMHARPLRLQCARWLPAACAAAIASPPPRAPRYGWSLWAPWPSLSGAPPRNRSPP